MKSVLIGAACGATLSASATSAATVGSLVAFGDEWTLSNTAFSGDRPNAEQLTENLAALLGGTNYLIATGNGLAYGSDFETHLTGLGKTLDRTTSQTTLQAALATVDAVFVAGTVGSGLISDLTTFINNGGDVVVSLGTGNFGNSVNEAAAWNPLLNAFGLTASSAWTTAAALTPISPVNDGPSSLDDGVSWIQWGYGNQISVFNGASDVQLVTGTERNNTINAIGVAPGGMAPVPLPASLPLLLAGLGVAGIVARRKT